MRSTRSSPAEPGTPPDGPAPRLAAGVLVSALVRHVGAAGGQATVLAKGDPEAGALLILLAERGHVSGAIERVLGPDGYRWGPGGPDDPAALDAYVARRRRVDPDLWVVELDHAEAARLAGEVTG